MLNRLLTPLRAHFEQLPVPRSATVLDAHDDHEEEDDTSTAENFARDVIIELMRNSVESLKEAGDLDTRIEVRNTVHSGGLTLLCNLCLELM